MSAPKPQNLLTQRQLADVVRAAREVRLSPEDTATFITAMQTQGVTKMKYGDIVDLAREYKTE